jgi:L-cysteine desulfidase
MAKEGLLMQALNNSGEGHSNSQVRRCRCSLRNVLKYVKSVVIDVTRTIDIHPQKCEVLV